MHVYVCVCVCVQHVYMCNGPSSSHVCVCVCMCVLYVCDRKMHLYIHICVCVCNIKQVTVYVPWTCIRTRIYVCAYTYTPFVVRILRCFVACSCKLDSVRKNNTKITFICVSVCVCECVFWHVHVSLILCSKTKSKITFMYIRVRFLCTLMCCVVCALCAQKRYEHCIHV